MRRAIQLLVLILATVTHCGVCPRPRSRAHRSAIGWRVFSSQSISPTDDSARGRRRSPGTQLGSAPRLAVHHQARRSIRKHPGFFRLHRSLAPGQKSPFHKHDNAEEILIFEEGGATVMVGDQRAVTGPRSIVFIPRDTWISATNSGQQSIHLVSVFSRRGFESYLRSIGVKPAQPMLPFSPDELPRLRALGHSMYWATSKGPYPLGVAHP
jgi:mannose-6-phosphate isomerase-like protein (cupin superfamily)